MKKLINKINGWSTTKKSFYFALILTVIYIAVNLTMNWFERSVDSTLTEETFSTIRLIITSGGVLTGTKIVKNK